MPRKSFSYDFANQWAAMAMEPVRQQIFQIKRSVNNYLAERFFPELHSPAINQEFEFAD